jgi:hypothetical protein
MMPMLWDADRPTIPSTYIHEIVPGGDGATQKRDMAVRSALVLRQQFRVHGDVLEKVKVHWYLGCLLLQDDDDIQAVQSQLCRHAGRGHGLDRCCAGKMHHLGLASSSTRQSSNPSSCMEGRRGS